MGVRAAYPGGIKLTKKKARDLAIQEFGTASGLAADPYAMPGYFVMQLGNLHIQIKPDICGSGCIVLRASMVGGTGTCIQYHDADTLRENFDVEERHSQEEQRNRVEDLGPEAAHAAVDRIWNGR